MLDWKCLLRSSTQSALVGHGRVYLGSGFGEGHVPYGETAWQRGKKGYLVLMAIRSASKPVFALCL